jgi:hypothetical protein
MGKSGVFFGFLPAGVMTLAWTGAVVADPLCTLSEFGANDDAASRCLAPHNHQDNPAPYGMQFNVPLIVSTSAR